MTGTETKSIREAFAADHDRLDYLFAEFQRLKRIDYPKAKENFKQFKTGLQRHIVWEEQILFPLFEKQTGMRDVGPTAVMRAEHRQIGARLEALHDKVRHADPESDHEEEALVQLLSQHNLKEEMVLYPAMDRMLGEPEIAAAFQAMEQLPKEAYVTCCGHHHTAVQIGTKLGGEGHE
jgi:iron-sulfur cluster repair protein YtfE (RIC family)